MATTIGHRFKVSELFFSCQGESQYVGVPSVFVRLFGCNFTCAGFGMPRGQLSTERDKVDAKQYSDYDSLPLVASGCDSYASWDVRFKHLSPTWTTDQLIEKIVALLPNGRFSRDVHLILTGGEPLLNWQRGFPELLERLRVDYGLTHVTFETNGTKKLVDGLREYIVANPTIEFFFSISAKLPVSGEKWEEAILPEVVRQYVDTAADGGNVQAAFKFVVAEDADLQDVHRAVQQYKDGGVDIPVYLMPVGGTDQVYFFNNKTVAELALVNGYRYTPRLQVDLWKNAWGT
jgi:7-carboxy-7-deazaguanine synthase